MKARQLSVDFLSEVEEVKAASQREKDRFLHSLKAVCANCKEDRKKQQEVVNLFKKLKYHQGYRDCEKCNAPRYPLEDEVGSASKDAEEEAFDGEEGEWRACG